MENTELVTLIVSRDQHLNYQSAKLDSVSREELVKGVMDLRARDLFTLVKVLITQFGKEKAKELIEEAQYAAFYQRAREAAEKLGNPTDLDSYIKWQKTRTGNIPSAPMSEVVERTKNNYVFRSRNCYQAESVLKYGVEDPEILEVIKYCCPHDTGVANGFNPKMRFKRTKFLLDGDDCCEFVAEVD
jgi:hypothetical protein